MPRRGRWCTFQWCLLSFLITDFGYVVGVWRSDEPNDGDDSALVQETTRIGYGHDGGGVVYRRDGHPHCS